MVGQGEACLPYLTLAAILAGGVAQLTPTLDQSASAGAGIGQRRDSAWLNAARRLQFLRLEAALIVAAFHCFQDATPCFVCIRC